MHVLCVSEVGKWTLSLLEKNRKFQIIIEKLWDKYCQLCSLFSCLVYSYTVVMFGILGGTQLQSLVSVIILDSPTHSPLYPLFLAYFAICIVMHCRPLQFNYKRELLVLGACFSFPFTLIQIPTVQLICSLAFICPIHCTQSVIKNWIYLHIVIIVFLLYN